MSQTPMSGAELDRVLRAFLDAQNAENNGKLLYIRHGNLAFATEEELFTVIKLEAEGQ